MNRGTNSRVVGSINISVSRLVNTSLLSWDDAEAQFGQREGAGANQLPSRGWSLGAGDSGLGEGPTGYSSAFFLAIARLSPQFCLHTLDIPRGLTPVLAEVPALIAVIPPLAAHVRFPSSFGGLLHRRHGWMSVLVNAAAPPRDGPAPGGKARRHA